MSSSPVSHKKPREQTIFHTRVDPSQPCSKKQRSRQNNFTSNMGVINVSKSTLASLTEQLEKAKQDIARLKNAFSYCLVPKRTEFTFFDAQDQLNYRAILVQKYQLGQSLPEKDKIVLLPRNTLFYKGHTKDNIPHGYGKSYRAESKYKGDFFEGRRRGRGLLEFPGGETFEGTWFNDVLQGVCKHTYPRNIDGDYEGNFIDGKKYGYGEETFYRRQKYEGYWKCNVRQGQGKLTVFHPYNQDGEGQVLMVEREYTGEFDQNQRHGIGKELVYATNTLYEGGWYCNLKHGRGKETDLSGNVYEGCWEYDLMHGKFVLNSTLGDTSLVCHLEFANGKRLPQAKLFYSDGRHYIGSIDESTPPNPIGEGIMTFNNSTGLTGMTGSTDNDVGIGNQETLYAVDLTYEDFVL